MGLHLSLCPNLLPKSNFTQSFICFQFHERKQSSPKKKRKNHRSKEHCWKYLHHMAEKRTPQSVLFWFYDFNYKVVLITRDRNDGNDGNQICVTIFCSEIGKWCTTKLLSSLQRPFDVLDGFMLSNGIIYWTSERTISEVEEVKVIVGFDPFNNDSTDPKRWRIIDRPVDFVSGWHSYKDKVRPGLLRGRLRLSQLVKRTLEKVGRDDYFVLKVWELDYDKDGLSTSWHLVHKVGFRRPDTDTICVLAFHPNNGDVVFMSCNENIYKYEIIKNEYEIVGRFPDRILYHNISTNVSQGLTKFISVFTLVHPSCPMPVPTLLS